MLHNVSFINREKEIAFLKEAYADDKAQLIVLYGRRRVGKTCLLTHFMQGKKHTYYLCTKGNETEQIKLLSRMIGERLDDTALTLSPFSEWHSLFLYLHEKAKKERYLLVIDEFPYLININPAITSIFQKYWDEYLSKTKIMLVLCGSSIAMMESEVLAHKSPLYGRRTGQWKADPLSFKDASKFFPEKSSIEEIIRTYTITGGVPYYLQELDLQKSAISNILEKIAKKGKLLYEEGEILLKEELRDPSTYFSILEAMSSGNTKQAQIANHVSMPQTALPRYLSTLERLAYIKKITPVTEPKTSKKTIYRLNDNFMNFWFKFIYPNKSYIEEGNYDRFKEILDNYFELHVSFAFEDISRQFLKTLNARGKLPPGFTKFGTWWGHYRENNIRKEHEIDIVALNETTKDILFSECKWKNNVSAKKTLKDLKEKSEHVQWHNDKRISHYAIFAKTFKEKTEDALLFDLDDLAAL
ncbi:MAG: ATP-binding protein [archaeon]